MDSNYPQLSAPLHQAAAGGCDLELVTHMIEGGGNTPVWPVNVLDGIMGQVPLHSAAANRCPFHGPAILEYLISMGGDVNAKDSIVGETPLHIASSQGLKKHVELLLEHGANPAATDDAGDTPLDVATKAEIKNILEVAQEKRRVRLGLPPVPLIEGPF